MTRESPSKELELSHCPDSTRISKNPCEGVYLRKTGKWVSEICDPVTHSRLHLGTFLSAEAAHVAYCAKKLELDEKAASKKQKKAYGFDSFHSEHSSNEYSDQKNGFHTTKWTKSGTVSRPSRYPTQVQVGKTGKTSFGYISASDSDNSSSDWRSEEYKKATSDEDSELENTCRFLSRPKNRRIAHVGKAEVLMNHSPRRQKINLRTPYKWVVQRASGKLVATVQDPVTHSRSYLGPFGSAEAAHAAWCSKKLEIDEKNLKNINNYKCVVKAKSGNKWVARIQHPTKGLIYLGNFGSKEAAFRAHYRKKLEIEENENDKIGEVHIESPPKQKIISEGVFKEERSGKTFGSAEAAYKAYCATKLEIKEKAASKSNEREVGKTSNEPEFEGKADLEEKKPQEGGYGPDAVSHIVDRNGFLLGEFSQIDDMAICDAD